MSNYYAIIGIDGCGKSSVHAKLCESLSDSAIFVSEPYLRSSLLSTDLGLDAEVQAYNFAIDRHCIMKDVIEPNIQKTIISDRCFICSLAYQGYDGLSLDWLMGIQPMNLIKPDLAIWLWCHPELAAKRSKEDPIRLKHIQEWYYEALEVAEVDYVKIEVTNMSKDEVFNEVMRHVTN